MRLCDKHIPAEMLQSAKCYNPLLHFCAKCDNWTFLHGICLSHNPTKNSKIRVLKFQNSSFKIQIISILQLEFSHFFFNNFQKK